MSQVQGWLPPVDMDYINWLERWQQPPQVVDAMPWEFHTWGLAVAERLDRVRERKWKADHPRT